METTVAQTTAQANQRPTAGEPTEVPAQMVRAWSSHDASAFADLFVDNGVMVLPGIGCYGKTDIEAVMADAFAGPYRNTTVVGEPQQIRTLGSDAVILFTEGGVVQPGQDGPSAEARIRATWVLINTDQGWKIQAYQNSQFSA